MELSQLLWDELLKIYPSEFSRVYYVNISGNILFKNDNILDIFNNTKWLQLMLEIRGNCLFAYNDDHDMGKVQPVMAWTLEHACLELRQSTHLLTLPSSHNPHETDNSRILYLYEENGHHAFMAVYLESRYDGVDLLARLRRCSIGKLKGLDGSNDKNLVDSNPDVDKNFVLNRLESLKYEHDFLKNQQEALKLDNTLLLTETTTSRQVYSECARLHLHENIRLKTELERALDNVDRRDKYIETLERELKDMKKKVCEGQETNDELQKIIASANVALNDANLMPENKLRVMYIKRTKQLNEMTLKFENIKILNKYNYLKSELNEELSKIEQFVQFDNIYEMLKLWVSCNELKVDYYENMNDMSIDEQTSLIKEIENIQNELRVSIVMSRASYIIYRTMIFNEMLNSVIDDKVPLNGSRNIINNAFERLSWLFQPEKCSAESLWKERGDSEADKLWYNRVSFASALKPVIKYDCENIDVMDIKKQMYQCINQNNQLKQQLRSLNRQIGSDSHWKHVWKRAHHKLKSHA